MAAYGVDIGGTGLGTAHLPWDMIEAEGKVRDHRIRFAILQASIGLLAKTSAGTVNFLSNWRGLRSTGLVRGAWHFFVPNMTPKASLDDIRGHADQQIEAYLDQVGFVGGIGDLPPIIDLEENDKLGFTAAWVGLNKETYSAGALRWVMRMRDRADRWPIVYTRANFWRMLGNPPGFSDCPLWVVDISENSEPDLPEGWSKYILRQFKFNAPVQIKSVGRMTFDLDEFKGSYAQLRTLAGLAPAYNPIEV